VAYPHPTTSCATTLTVWRSPASGDHPDRSPATGDPWQPFELSTTRCRGGRLGRHARGDAGRRHGVPLLHSVWRSGREAGEAKPVRSGGTGSTTGGSACGDFFHVRDDALRAHGRRSTRTASGSRFPRGVQALRLPTEELSWPGRSVDTSMPEYDLFAGVRERFGASRPAARPFLTTG